MLQKSKDYLIKVLNGMAKGLFSSLIIGLILVQLGSFLKIDILIQSGKVAKYMMGPAIGAGVALSLEAPALVVVSAIAAGALGAGMLNTSAAVMVVHIGDATSALICSLLATELGKLVNGKTQIEIIAVPAITISSAGLTAYYISPHISRFMQELGSFINMLAHLHPLPMGILLAVVMGMLLTLPISSAAIAIALGLSGLAAGASTVGCCSQMIGFAVISYADNGIANSVAQGIGTSMLQIGNIVKNPWVWLPPILSSAILGPIATVVFKMTNTPIAAGMGTSGLVGQIGTLESMGNASLPIIIIMHIIAPAFLSYFFYKLLLKAGKIKSGDLKLD